MGSNIRQTGSVRDIREGNLVSLDKPETPEPPSWLSKAAKKEFKNLVTGLVAANVPLKSVDCHAIGMAASSVVNVGIWTINEAEAIDLEAKVNCSKLVARYLRESQLWLNVICATPLSRARLGIKTDMKQEGPLAQLLKAKNQNAN